MDDAARPMLDHAGQDVLQPEERDSHVLGHHAVQTIDLLVVQRGDAPLDTRVVKDGVDAPESLVRRLPARRHFFG